MWPILPTSILPTPRSANSAADLDGILDHFDKLNEADTSGVEPMAQVLFDAEPTATLREDVPVPPLGQCRRRWPMLRRPGQVTSKCRKSSNAKTHGHRFPEHHQRPGVAAGAPFQRGGVGGRSAPLRRGGEPAHQRLSAFFAGARHGRRAERRRTHRAWRGSGRAGRRSDRR